MIWRYVSVHGEGITFSVRTWLGHGIHSIDLKALGLNPALVLDGLTEREARERAAVIDRAMSANATGPVTRYKR